MVVLMCIPICESTSVNDYRMIEQRAIAILRSLQFVEEVRELARMEFVDPGDLFHLIRISLVVS